MAPPNRATNEFSDPAPTGERGRDSSCTLTCIISINEFSDPAPTGERGRDSSCTLTCIISKLKHANLSADFNTQKAIQAIWHDQMINISGHCSKKPKQYILFQGNNSTLPHLHVLIPLQTIGNLMIPATLSNWNLRTWSLFKTFSTVPQNSTHANSGVHHIHDRGIHCRKPYLWHDGEV